MSWKPALLSERPGIENKVGKRLGSIDDRCSGPLGVWGKERRLTSWGAKAEV